MARSALILTLLTLIGCDSPTEGTSRAGLDQSPENLCAELGAASDCDPCEVAGFFGDGVCDAYCPLAADPDCERGAPVLIHEIRYDGPGADAAHVFVELSGPVGHPLTGYSLAGINGANGREYTSFDLRGPMEDGVFVIAHTSASESLEAIADQLHPAVDFQNGPDSVQLRRGPFVVDAIGYGDSGVHFAGEGDAAADITGLDSLSRDADGSDTDNNARDFTSGEATPGRALSMPMSPDPVLTCVAGGHGDRPPQLWVTPVGDRFIAHHVTWYQDEYERIYEWRYNVVGLFDRCIAPAEDPRIVNCFTEQEAPIADHWLSTTRIRRAQLTIGAHDPMIREGTSWEIAVRSPELGGSPSNPTRQDFEFQLADDCQATDTTRTIAPAPELVACEEIEPMADEADFSGWIESFGDTCREDGCRLNEVSRYQVPPSCWIHHESDDVIRSLLTRIAPRGGADAGEFVDGSELATANFLFQGDAGRGLLYRIQGELPQRIRAWVYTEEVPCPNCHEFQHTAIVYLERLGTLYLIRGEHFWDS